MELHKNKGCWRWYDEKRFEQSLQRYYKFLSASIFKRKDEEFWEFQKKGLDKLGIRLNRVRLFTGALEALANKIIFRLFHPSLTWKKFFQENPKTTKLDQLYEKSSKKIKCYFQN